MQSTVGNLPEFFVVIFALQAGQQVVAETAILGSILVNALLVLGLVIVAGALRERKRDGIMRFNPRLPNDTATLLLVASFIIVLIGLDPRGAGDSASHHSKTISIIGAVAILVVYATWLRQYLTTPESAGRHVPASRACRSSPASSCWWSRAPRRPSSRTGSSTRSSRRSSTLHISKAFAGLVIVAIAGNAVEHVVGHRARRQGPVRPGHLGGQELGGADRRVPVSAARAGLAADRDHADLLARAGVHRRPARDRR